MKRSRILAAVLVCGVVMVAGCRSGPIALTDTRGSQWVWPYFAQQQPTVLAFWDTVRAENRDSMPAWNALHHRPSSVQLITVCCSEDRARATMWLRRENAQFTVIMDSERKLAKRLGVDTFPTYILLNINSKEIDRRLQVNTVQNWFDRQHYLDQAMLTD